VVGFAFFPVRDACTLIRGSNRVLESSAFPEFEWWCSFSRNNSGTLLDAWDAMSWLLGDDIRVFV
jgi:hypothetical protein